MALLRRLNCERGVSAVLVTYNEALAGEADRVARLRDGQVERMPVLPQPP